MRSAAVATALALVVTGCAADVPDGLEVAEGWSVEVVRDDLDGPTQLALGPGGRDVYVAELGGSEGEATGRVTFLGEAGRGEQRAAVLERLTTPTGLVVLDDSSVLVQEGRDLVRFDLLPSLGAQSPPSGTSRQVLAADLPWNGRSQGTLTLVDDGRRVLHSATHAGTEPDVVEGSGAVYVTPVDGSAAPQLLAAGFKVPYAHALGPDGALWVTDLNEGRVDGEQLPDEVHRFEGVSTNEPADGGWPSCVGDNEPVQDHGARAGDCAGLPAPAVVLPARSSPTGIAVTDDRVLLALFTTPLAVEGRVVEVAADGTLIDVLRGVMTPQDVLALPDGSFLVSTHVDGQLLRLVPS